VFTAALHAYQRVDAGFPIGFVDGAHRAADTLVPVLALLVAVDALAPPEISSSGAARMGRERSEGTLRLMVESLL
jgi:hypothetical protein